MFTPEQVIIASHWKHRNGNLYIVVGFATMQVSSGDLDMQKMVLYHQVFNFLTYGEIKPIDSRVWCRPMSEFIDGRFSPFESGRRCLRCP